MSKNSIKTFFKNKKIAYNNYLKTHKKFNIFQEYFICFFLTIISSILITLGFKLFLSPNVDNSITIVSGGTSGIGMITQLIFQICKSKINTYTIYSITYFTINIPIFFLAFKIGIKYGIFTIINIGLTSIFTNFINIDFLNEFANQIACVIKVDGVYFQAGIMTRLILAAIFSSLGTVVALSADTSAGGIDTFAHYLSIKKSSSLGKYFIIINSLIILVYSVLDLVYRGFTTQGLTNATFVLVIAIVYQLFLSIIVDALNRNNIKEQLQIITNKEDVYKALIKNSRHGATVVNAKGAYTNENKYIIYMVIVKSEIPKMVNIIKEVDPNSFINVVDIRKIYGRFILR